MDATARLRERLDGAQARRAPPLVLDGALGTELERRGVPTQLPLWSARALLADPEAVAAIHRDYVAAGGGAHANTFAPRCARSRASASARARPSSSGAPSRSARMRASPRCQPSSSARRSNRDCYRPTSASGDALSARLRARGCLVAAGVDAIPLLDETPRARPPPRAGARGQRRRVLAASSATQVGGSLGRSARGRAPPALRSVRSRVREMWRPNGWNLPARLASRAFPLRYPTRRADAELVRAARELAPAAFGALARGWIAAGAAAVGGCSHDPAHVAASPAPARAPDSPSRPSNRVGANRICFTSRPIATAGRQGALSRFTTSRDLSDE